MDLKNANMNDTAKGKKYFLIFLAENEESFFMQNNVQFINDDEESDIKSSADNLSQKEKLEKKSNHQEEPYNKKNNYDSIFLNKNNIEMLSDEESSLSEEMNEHNDISVKQPNSLILVNPNMNKNETMLQTSSNQEKIKSEKKAMEYYDINNNDAIYEEKNYNTPYANKTPYVNNNSFRILSNSPFSKPNTPNKQESEIVAYTNNKQNDNSKDDSKINISNNLIKIKGLELASVMKPSPINENDLILNVEIEGEDNKSLNPSSVNGSSKGVIMALNKSKMSSYSLGKDEFEEDENKNNINEMPAYNQKSLKISDKFNNSKIEGKQRIKESFGNEKVNNEINLNFNINEIMQNEDYDNEEKNDAHVEGKKDSSEDSRSEKSQNSQGEKEENENNNFENEENNQEAAVLDIKTNNFNYDINEFKISNNSSFKYNPSLKIDNLHGNQNPSIENQLIEKKFYPDNELFIENKNNFIIEPTKIINNKKFDKLKIRRTQIIEGDNLSFLNSMQKKDLNKIKQLKEEDIELEVLSEHDEEVAYKEPIKNTTSKQYGKISAKRSKAKPKRQRKSILKTQSKNNDIISEQFSSNRQDSSDRQLKLNSETRNNINNTTNKNNDKNSNIDLSKGIGMFMDKGSKDLLEQLNKVKIGNFDDPNKKKKNISNNGEVYDIDMKDIHIELEKINELRLESENSHNEEKKILIKQNSASLADTEVGFYHKIFDEEFLREKNIEKINFNRDKEYLTKLKYEADKKHPRLFTKNKELIYFPICETKTGCVGCCKKYEESDLNVTGLGIIMYLKILKTLGILFLIICLFNVVLYWVYASSHDESPIATYMDLLFKTTIGNIGATIFNCVKMDTSSLYSGNSNSNYTLQMDCGDNYYISDILALGATVQRNNTLKNDVLCRNFITSLELGIEHCNFFSYFETVLKNSRCKGKKSCSLGIQKSQIRSNCTYESNIRFYAAYACFDPYIRLNLNNINFDRQNFAFLAVGLDVVSMIALYITILLITRSQVVTRESFDANYVKISNFSLHFTNLRLNMNNIDEEINRFLTHLFKVYHYELEKKKLSDEAANDKKIKFSQESKKLHEEYFSANENVQNLNVFKKENIVYDINYPINYNKINIIFEKNELELKKAKLQMRINELPAAEVLKIKSSEEDLKEIFLRIQKLDEKYLNSKKTNEIINDVYITFYNTDQCEEIKKAYKKSQFYRFCLWCCCSEKRIKHLYFDDRWLKIKDQIDDPSNIKWENVQYSSCNRGIRTTCAVILSIVVILLSVLVVMASKFGEEQIDSNYNTSVDCKYLTSPTMQGVIKEITDSSLGAKDRIETYCYCLNYLYSKGISDLKGLSVTVNNKTIYPCSSWLDLWLQSRAWKILVIVLVPTFNIILSLLLEGLTTFEKNKFSSTNMTSIMWKSFILQAINTGIIIILVNIKVDSVIKWNSEFPFFTGKYADLDPAWYFDVGSTIIFYMIINIFSPHLASLLKYFYLVCKRKCDRSSSKSKYTSKLTKTEYLKLYVGPEFLLGSRYAEILCTIFISLIYSSGMPILYASCFLYFIITYWIDKWMILRFYRTPPHTDMFMSKLFSQLMLLGIIIHFCFGIWTYGDKQIFFDSNSALVKTINEYLDSIFGTNILAPFSSTNFTATLKERILLPHNLIILVFLLIFFLIFLFKLVLKKLFMYILFLNWCDIKCSRAKKIRSMQLCEFIPFESAYYNVQLKIAQFLKYAYNKSNPKDSFIRTKYFLEGINKDKLLIENIIKGIRVNNSSILQDVSNTEYKFFKKDVLNYLKSGNYKVDDKEMKGETSYNMVMQYKFRYLIDYEYLLPLKRK